MAIKTRPVSAPQMLNEAYTYANPVPFSRAFRVDVGRVTILFVSGTASVDEEGKTVHPGNIVAQTNRMFRNVTALLAAEGADWHNVVRTTYYFRDIDRDYATASQLRMEFFQEVGLRQFPASTGIEAHLCRPDLLIEMEAIAIYETKKTKRRATKKRAR